jgi:hypothetical protein
MDISEILPASKNIPFIDSPMDCSWIEAFGSSRDSQWSALLHLCGTNYRSQLQAWVIPAFKDRLIQLSFGTGIIEDAFVSFISGPILYMNLAHWAIAAAMEFSSKPVLLFISGEAVPVASSRFPSSRFPKLVIFEVPSPSLHPWFDKLRAVLLSPVLNGVIIESDTIITPHAERLFAVAKLHATHFSLSPMHEDERLSDCSNYRGTRSCVNPYNFPVERRSIPYIHAHMIWNFQSKPFVSRVLSTCVETPDGSDCGSDEGALNWQLWKEKATKYLCMIDPFTSVLESWEKQELPYIWLQPQNFAVVFLHGAKDPARAEHVFNRLKKLTKQNLPWVYIGANRKWSNQTDEVLARSLAEADGCIL